MNELMLMIASSLPKERLVELLDDELSKYKAAPTDENFNRLTSTCVLIVSRNLTDGVGVENAMKDMEELDTLKRMTTRGKS